MFTNTPFESAAKTMLSGSQKFTPASAQEALKPLLDNLKAWGDLAQQQAQASQAAIAETVESFKSIKDPQAAMDAIKVVAESGMAMAAKNVQEATALSVAQFNANVDSLEKSSPAPESFAGVAKGMKAAASSMENALETVIKNGSAAAKKARAA